MCQKDDVISRQAAIDALGKDPGFKVRLFGKSYDEGRSDQWFRDVYKLTTVPSVQPYTDEEIRRIQELEQAQFDKMYELGYQAGHAAQPEPRWIPCDKGEPDEDMECWVTVKTTDALYRGNFTKRYGERRDKGFITSGGFMWWNTALAWMPIYEPEPYKGGEDE